MRVLQGVPMVMTIVSMWLSGCGGSARFTAARATLAAVEAVDQVIADRIDEVCPDGCPEADSACRVHCDEDLARLEALSPVVDAAYRVSGAAVAALLAAEEGDDPPDLNERLSCAAAAFLELAQAVRLAGFDLPDAVQRALDLLATFGGLGRQAVLSSCRGWDDRGAAGVDTTTTVSPEPPVDTTGDTPAEVSP